MSKLQQPTPINRLMQRKGIAQPVIQQETAVAPTVQSYAFKPQKQVENTRPKSIEGAKKMVKSKTEIGFQFDDSLAEEVNAEIQKDIEKRKQQLEHQEKVKQQLQDASTQGIHEILSKIDNKLNSAKEKFVRQSIIKKPSEFKITEEKTPSTATKTQRSQTSERTPNDKAQKEADMETPTMFKSTDADGNRCSILPGSSRPKTQISQPKSQLEILQEEIKKAPKTKNTERKNFVRLNANNYKPRMRGAAFTNKIMAKKTNSLKFKARYQQKMKLEQMKNRDQVNTFGGLGKVGLDYKHAQEEGAEYEVPAFSSKLQHLASGVKGRDMDEEDMLCSDFEDMEEELLRIDEQIEEEVKQEEEEIQDIDKPMYEIPTSDEGYLKILKERFGHSEFREGQLEAIKIMLKEKRNVLVVLATGGGKSLIYQFTTLFVPGLVLVVTPLIALMTDQLNKLPDFIPGAALNSQQSFELKKKVVQAVQEGKIKTLFITPERLFTEDLQKFGRKISMVCVDEIHCASEWSHNFRPTYLMLHEMIREKLGSETIVLGLTATATKSTQKQICKIFDIKYPDHLVTQPDLSRLNLQLSITRDQEKTKALMTLLKSECYQKITSILLFATQRQTTEQVASFLCSQGIQSAAYHAGKSDEQRSFTQKQFCANKIRVLCCTIAFSMGIDKSDIQSVIHYDMPRSIENYIQEIGRAGRDGTLARCHMFLNNDDFYQLRRITLSDLLDSQSGFRLTNRVIAHAKRELYKVIKPDSVASKKRKRKVADDDEVDPEDYQALMDLFENEEDLKPYYNDKGRIRLDEVPEVQASSMYIALECKELLTLLDLKKEVVMTMLNQLEQVEGSFFRVDSILPASIGIRFHKQTLEEIAATDKFFRCVLSLSPKAHQGVYRIQTVKIAQALGCKPYNIPRILYQIQQSDQHGISYETDHESFILQVHSIPTPSDASPLAIAMLAATNKIENALVQKLNCMYFVARKVSMASIEAMQKKERLQDGSKEQMYLDFSKQLNELINIYFKVEDEETMELQITGGEEERSALMPLLYADSHRAKSEIEADIKQILKEFHHGQAPNMILDPSNRMKPLDAVKVMMGIQSSRECVKRFSQDANFWARRQDFDYKDLLKVAVQTVQQYYCENLPTSLGQKRAH